MELLVSSNNCFGLSCLACFIDGFTLTTQLIDSTFFEEEKDISSSYLWIYVGRYVVMYVVM